MGHGEFPIWTDITTDGQKLVGPDLMQTSKAGPTGVQAGPVLVWSLYEAVQVTPRLSIVNYLSCLYWNGI